MIALLAAVGFGFRHGFDFDHIAALTDITGSQTERRRSITLATFYACGHALVVFVLGLGVVVFARKLPSSIDDVTGRVVGATLIGLGLYIVIGLWRHGADFRLRSRWLLLVDFLRRVPRRDVVVIEHDHPHAHDQVHTHDHVEVDAGETAPVIVGHRHLHRHIGWTVDDPFSGYGAPTSFLIGMLHGVGAETPTQVLLFAAASGAAGRAAGVGMLVAFIVGLLGANTLVAFAGTLGFMEAGRNNRLYVAVSLLAAAFSFAYGASLL